MADTTVDVSISMSTHVGDDATETDDLTIAEYGIHCRLRRALWRRGGFLDADRDRLRRLVGAVNDAEVAALDSVIARLWTTSAEGTISHTRTVEEIERARAKKASYSERGKLGGRPPKAQPKLGKSSALAEGKAGGKTPPPPPPPPPPPDPTPPPPPETDTCPAGGPAGPCGVGDVPLLKLVVDEPEGQKATKLDSVNNVLAVFEHYTSKHGHPSRRRPNPTSKTWRAIAARLRDKWSVDDLLRAIDGYHLSPWHLGQNADGKKHLELELFMRDEEHVVKGLDFAENPPKPGNGASTPARDPRVGAARAEDYVHTRTGEIKL